MVTMAPIIAGFYHRYAFDRTIGWHVPVGLFTQDPDIFFLFLQTLRLTPGAATVPGRKRVS